MVSAPPCAQSTDSAAKNRCAKLALGTVQWGMTYGIANRHGKAAAGEIQRMLEFARSHGVSMLDTARAYGDAEAVIGAQRADAQGFRVVTKVCGERTDEATVESVAAARAGFGESLTRIGAERVYGCLVHNAQNLLVPGAERLWEMLVGLRAAGLTAKIGVSVYHPRQLEDILARYEIDLVQLPFNLYDQRFAGSGMLAALKRKGVEVHARSAFLQGLLLMPAFEMPGRFATVREHQARLHSELDGCGVTPVEGALRFALARKDIDHVVVGVEMHHQLEELLEIASQDSRLPESLARYALNDGRIIDPSQWNENAR